MMSGEFSISLADATILVKFTLVFVDVIKITPMKHKLKKIIFAADSL